MPNRTHKTNSLGIPDVTQLWSDIGEFEKREVEAWKDFEPTRQEARACARMQAYVELVDKMLDTQTLIIKKSK